MPLMHCVYYSEKRNVFSDRQKTAAVHDGSCKFLGSEFQNIRPATENSRQPYVVSRWDGITSWWSAAERRCCPEAVVETGTKHAARYREQNRTDIGVWSHRVCTLYLTRAGTSSQWSSVCISCFRPRSNFRVPLTTRAAEFNTRCNLLVEPQRRQRYSSRRADAGRHEGVRARASWQTPKSVSAGCAVYI